jgi:hypothetical protein
LLKFLKSHPQEDKTDFLPLGVFAARQKEELQETDADQDVRNSYTLDPAS